MISKGQVGVAVKALMNPIEGQRGNYKSEGRATICSGYEDKQSGI